MLFCSPTAINKVTLFSFAFLIENLIGWARCLSTPVNRPAKDHRIPLFMAPVGYQFKINCWGTEQITSSSAVQEAQSPFNLQCLVWSRFSLWFLNWLHYWLPSMHPRACTHRSLNHKPHPRIVKQAAHTPALKRKRASSNRRAPPQEELFND